MFIKNKIFFKVGVWTDVNAEETQFLIKSTLQRFEGSLLFKYASPNDSGMKDLQRVWHNYNGYDVTNTLYIDYKDALVQKKNQLIIDKFSNDNALLLLKDYLKFFSYQFHYKKIHSLSDFMIKTPFQLFMREYNKPAATDDPRTRKFG